MYHTIFNPATATGGGPEPVHVMTLHSRQKVHMAVITTARTIRFAKTKDVLEHGNNGGTPISDTTGAIEVELFGDVWMHGVSGNAGSTIVDIEI